MREVQQDLPGGGKTTAPRRRPRPRWRNREVWAISLSAFFSDTGYQGVLAGFPLFLVLTLHQPVWEFGLASAIAYGGGTLFAWAGALLGDRFGHRRVAITGNALIPLLSLSALWANPAVAIGLLCAGWWARNLRTPSRRVMLVEAVPAEDDRNSVFGFLHALDIGGGALAGTYVLIAVIEHVAFKWIFLGSALPLAIATFSLTRCTTGRKAPASTPQQEAAPGARAPGAPQPALPGATPFLVAAALFGFTYYSVGFPVLTTAQGSGHLSVGIGAFLLLNAVSAATGYFVGPRLGSRLPDRFRDLGALGYLFSVVGAALLAFGYGEHLGTVTLMFGVVALGFALGIVETVEPSLMSVLRPGRRAGRGFGALTAARSVGLALGNVIMGLLYGLGAEWAYGYAAVAGAAAVVIVLGAIPAARRAEGQPGQVVLAE